MSLSTRLTINGAVLLAKALNGKTLKFTRGAFGDAIVSGEMANPTAAEQDALNALIHERMSLPIASYAQSGDQLVVTLNITNANVRQNFKIAEYGLFAEDPDTKAEMLYGYCFTGNDGGTMHAANTDVVLEFQCEMITKVGNAANVTAVVDKSTIGIMRDEFEEHVNSTAPHPNWEVVKNGAGLWKTNETIGLDWAKPDQLGGAKVGKGLYMTQETMNASIAAVSTGLWKNNDTIGLEWAKPDQLGGIKVGKNLYMTQDSLNAAAASTDEFDARLKQIEINQANLYMLLQKDFSFGEKSNLQQVENFDPVSSTDTYAAQVYTTPSLKYLRIFEPGYLRVSGWFTVTNGRLNQEQTYIWDFAKSGNYDTPYIAKLDKALENEYPSSLTNYLYRSTVTIRDNKAYGAGEIKTRSQIGALTWKGEGNNDSQQIQFNAFASLESSFELEGDWSLTSDGYFTVG